MNEFQSESSVVGIDIGGSHITAAVVNLHTRRVVPHTLVRKRLNAHGTANEIIAEWAQAVEQVFQFDTAVSKKLGIAMPGPFEYEKGISLIKGLDKYEALYGLNVKELLREALQLADPCVLMMNDASCFLQGEVFAGAAKHKNNVIGITLGTGLGSARYHNGKIFDGDLYCTAFKNSTAEEYLATRWFVQRYHELTGKTVRDVKALIDQIAVEPKAQEVFTEFGENLGLVLAAYAQKHQAEHVVIGGNVMHAWELFIGSTNQTLAKHAVNVSLTKAVLGEEAALIGAASLWST